MVYHSERKYSFVFNKLALRAVKYNTFKAFKALKNFADLDMIRPAPGGRGGSDCDGSTDSSVCMPLSFLCVIVASSQWLLKHAIFCCAVS